MLVEETTTLQPEVAEKDKKRHIIFDVFVTIVIGTLQDLFNSTIGVLWKYVKHFALCLHYFWSPDIDRPPFNQFDYKDFCKRSFEAVIITLLISIFAVKVGWLAPTNDFLKEQLGNDIFQMSYEAGAFIAFAITYFLLVLLSVATGRLIRKWLTAHVTLKESDILMVTFFNAFFSLTALTAFVIRLAVPFQYNDLEIIITGVSVILFFTCLVLTILWAIRFIVLNQVRSWKAVLFFLVAVIFYTVIYTFGGLIATALLYIV